MADKVGRKLRLHLPFFLGRPGGFGEAGNRIMVREYMANKSLCLPHHSPLPGGWLNLPMSCSSCGMAKLCRSPPMAKQNNPLFFLALQNIVDPTHRRGHIGKTDGAGEQDQLLIYLPDKDRFRQVAALLTSAQKLWWTEDLAAEENLVRERWARLRREYHV